MTELLNTLSGNLQNDRFYDRLVMVGFILAAGSSLTYESYPSLASPSARLQPSSAFPAISLDINNKRFAAYCPVNTYKVLPEMTDDDNCIAG